MNSIVTLEEVKQGLRIDEDYEDSFIETITIPAAENAIRGALRRTWESIYEQHGEIPVEIKNAIIMLCGSLLKHREADANQVVNNNPAFRLLLSKHIKLTK